MRNQAQAISDPILVKNDETLWRHEKAVSFQVGSKSCGVAWCKKGCDRQWIKRQSEKLAHFAWDKTRHVILTVNPWGYKNGREAYEDIKNHRRIPELIRKLKRGKKRKVGNKWIWERKPLKITNWIVHLEWHKNGFPHWHLLIEIDSIGWRTRIGGDALRSIWNPGKFVYETYFKDPKHWRNLVGDFGKTGYFQKDKDHQAHLPSWAMDLPGYIIPRSSGQRLHTSSRRDAFDDYCERAIEEKVDLATGEILSGFKLKVSRVKLSYREKFKGCKQSIWAKITTANEVIEGVFKIPYREIYDKHKGTYLPKLGYVFRGSIQDIKEFLRRREKIIRYVSDAPNLHQYFRVGSAGWTQAINQGV